MNCPRITAYGGPRGFDQRMGIEKMSMPGRNKDAPRNPGIDKGLRRLMTKKPWLDRTYNEETLVL